MNLTAYALVKDGELLQNKTFELAVDEPIASPDILTGVADKVARLAKEQGIEVVVVYSAVIGGGL